jgi:hypothetical protein
MNWPDRNQQPGTAASQWVLDVLHRSSLERINFTVPGGLHVNGAMFREVARAVQRGTIAVSSGGQRGGTGTQQGVADGQIAVYDSSRDVISIPTDRTENVAFVVCHEAVHAYCDIHSMHINRLTEEAAGYIATAAANYHFQRVWVENNGNRTERFQRHWESHPSIVQSDRADVNAVYREAAELCHRKQIYANREDVHTQHDLADTDLYQLKNLISQVSWYRGIGADELSTQHNGLHWRSEASGDRFCLRENE